MSTKYNSFIAWFLDTLLGGIGLDNESVWDQLEENYL